MSRIRPDSSRIHLEALEEASEDFQDSKGSKISSGKEEEVSKDLVTYLMNSRIKLF